MATLRLTLINASRKPLPDEYDITVTAVNTGTTAFSKKGLAGTKVLAIKDLPPNTVYQVRVFPFRHRPVGQFVGVGGGASASATMATPLHPDRVQEVTFPTFSKLPAALRKVLDNSVLETSGGPAGPSGAVGNGTAVFNGLNTLEKAGLLNLFTKMSHTTVGTTPTWDFVTDLYRVRGDRIFANVTIPFRDAVKTAVTSGTVEEVLGTLHTPPPNFVSAKSFKTLDRYGNLQLTFFSSASPLPLAFKVDADVDDASGIGHLFQVLEHFITDSDTHPFDIHQILTFHQALNPLYELSV
jgi:hypothetical protein